MFKKWYSKFFLFQKMYFENKIFYVEKIMDFQVVESETIS
jgi:hypothetical protein